MDYEKEFYELIEKKKDEIKSLDISDNEKNNLYKLVDETIQRYEENKINQLEREESFVRLNKAWEKMFETFENINFMAKKTNSIAEKTLSKLEETVAKQRIKNEIFPQNKIPFSNN